MTEAVASPLIDVLRFGARKSGLKSPDRPAVSGLSLAATGIPCKVYAPRERVGANSEKETAENVPTKQSVCPG